ncbi:WcaF family extracellular polysaccharide biosynthesis acetyltransferase [Pedobacter aquatilis]|uniref:WcaF family extracellular polysaccharide biosynthesis acetyltransferase n=1 Tax=Pedobacter aquatilis TaxID=351343 RepID=UPI00292EA0F2|nr:WcaF family extracellular polysaccharide biosynthesis acetyltransferase [Pedobacter aquatilis]
MDNSFIKVQLRKNFDTGNFEVEASKFKQFLWYFTDVFFFRSKILPFSSVLVLILKLFGAKIGKQVRIKPGIYIKFPWKLEVGDYSWLAECYIENLDFVRIAQNCCISQRAVLMTGNHDYKQSSFDLMTKEIILEDGVWIGASAKVCPGVKLRSHSVLCMGSVAVTELMPYSIYQGNPAAKIKDRVII